MWQKTTTTTNTDNWYRFQNPVSFSDAIFNFTSLINLLFQEIAVNCSLYSNNENKLVQQKGNNGTYTKTSLLRSRLVTDWYFNSWFCRPDSTDDFAGFIFGRYKMELTSNYKTGRQFVFVNFHMGIKFRDNLFSRISIFAIFLQSRRTRN